MFLLKHTTKRHLEMPSAFGAYRRYGQLDQSGLHTVPGSKTLRQGRTDVYVSGPFLPREARVHQWPLLIYYVDAKGTLLGWLHYRYAPIQGVLYPAAMESVSWFGPHRVCDRVERIYEDGCSVPRQDVHTHNGAVHRVRHYRLLNDMSPSFVYEEQRGHGGVIERAVDMHRLSSGAWIKHTVHYPRRAHEQDSARHISLVGPEPLTVHGPGHILTHRHLDEVLTQPLFHRSLDVHGMAA